MRGWLLQWVFAALGVLVPVSSVAQISLPAAASGEVRGILAVRGDEVLVEEGADLRLTPASVQKLLTAAAILHGLGAEERFRTQLTTGPISAVGAVDSITLVGAGDPTWHDEFYEGNPNLPLEALARGAYGVGIRRVDGDVVVDASATIGRRVPVDWPVGDVALGYGTAPSAVAIHRNRTRIRISPGLEEGRPARILDPGGLRWRNLSVTVGRERHRKGTVGFELDWGAAEATLRGEYPISEPPFSLDLATPDPELRVGWELLQELREAGIDVRGRVRVVDRHRDEGNARAGQAVVATFSSPPMSEILVPMLADSDNFIAEMLLRHLGRRLGGAGRLDTGVEVLADFLSETVGIDEDAFVLDDGSGLSPSNLITPRAVVEVLRWAWRQPWREPYFEALAGPDRGTVGDFWPSAPPLRAKTGTLRHTQCLAGVLLPRFSVAASGEPGSEPVFFAWMLNHSTRERRAIRSEVMANLRAWHGAVF